MLVESAVSVRSGLSQTIWGVGPSIGAVSGNTIFGVYTSNGLNVSLNNNSDIQASIAMNGTACKQAAGLKNSNFAASVNGLLTIDVAPGTMVTGANMLTLGQLNWVIPLAGNNMLNGYVASIDYWNTRLPNKRLVELTGGGGSSGDIFPVNTVAPAITGIPSSSNTLTCSTGTWTNSASFTYRWYNNNSPILGAINSTLTLNSSNAPIGSKIFCAVTGHSTTGNNATAISNEVTVV